MIKTLRQLRDMDISEDCPKIRNLPDTIDPTKYYPYIQKILDTQYIKFEEVEKLINESEIKHSGLRTGKINKITILNKLDKLLKGGE